MNHKIVDVANIKIDVMFYQEIAEAEKQANAIRKKVYKIRDREYLGQPVDESEIEAMLEQMLDLRFEALINEVGLYRVIKGFARAVAAETDEIEDGETVLEIAEELGKIRERMGR